MNTNEIENFIINYKKNSNLNFITHKYIEHFLNDINENKIKLENVSKCFCGTKLTNIIETHDRFGLAFKSLICEKCGLVTTSPRIKEESLSYYYENFYHYLIYGEETLNNRSTLFSIGQGNKIFKTVIKYLDNPKYLNVLEIGCGTGSVLSEFREEANANGIEVDLIGTEYNEECKKHCKKIQIETTSNNLKEISNDKKKYDVIILSHVFEHFINLEKELLYLNNSLKENGILFIEVPGILNIHKNTYYKNSFKNYLIHAHMYNFSLESLKTILIKNQFIFLEGNQKVEAIFKKGQDTLKFNGADYINSYLIDLKNNTLKIEKNIIEKKEELFIYIDPGFASGLGHYRNFAKKIHRHCQNNNIEIQHYVNKNVAFEDKKRFNLIPFFSYNSIIDETLSYPKIEQRLNDFRINIKNIFTELIKKENIYTKIYLYMYTAHPLHIEILNDLYALSGLEKTKMHLVILHLNKELISNKKNKTLISLLRKIDNSCKNTKIYMDSHKANSIYQKFFIQKIENLAIPLHHEKEIFLENNQIEQKDKLTISFFGYANEKYGFHLFYEMYKYFGSSYSYIIRLNKKISDAKFESIINILKKDPDVLLLDDYLDDFYYDSLIKRSDLIVIPYLNEFYPVQTSGVFIDSLWYDKFIITTNNTWMSDMILKTKSGLTFENNDKNSMITSILLATKIIKIKDSKIDTKYKLNFTVEEMFKTIKG